MLHFIITKFSTCSGAVLALEGVTILLAGSFLLWLFHHFNKTMLSFASINYSYVIISFWRADSCSPNTPGSRKYGVALVSRITVIEYFHISKTLLWNLKGRVQKKSKCKLFPIWCWPPPRQNVNFLKQIKKKKCSQNLPKHILVLKKIILKPLFTVYRLFKNVNFGVDPPPFLKKDYILIFFGTLP